MGHRTWVSGATDASLASVLRVQPDLAVRYDTLVDGVWQAGIDPHVLELCRIRIAQQLGDLAGAALRSAEAAGLDEALVAALDRWWSHPGFDDVARSALSVAEQFTLDVHGVSDEQFAAVTDRLGAAGAVAFSFALALFDGQSRLRLAFATPERTVIP
jgi:alkylhydroperoxidase family enzyme